MTTNILKEQSCKNTVIEVANVHISEIKVGDTVLHNGELKTVCWNNITYDKFMGLSLFGDCYKLGYQHVKKVTKLKF